MEREREHMGASPGKDRRRRNERERERERESHYQGRLASLIPFHQMEGTVSVLTSMAAVAAEYAGQLA